MVFSRVDGRWAMVGGVGDAGSRRAAQSASALAATERQQAS
jgi:hypothetical protein